MECKQFPLINSVQKVVVYETKARYYVVGSNNTESRFRVIKIDRTEAKELNIVDDKVEYSHREMIDLICMIDEGNRPRQQQRGSNGLKRLESAFGILGFVRFLEGYYMILITKRRRMGLIGPHTIYKVEETSMIYLPNETAVRNYSHPDEQRYVKIFQNVDLSSNFYFSYSYDLTRSLQYNMAPCNVDGKVLDSMENSNNSGNTTSRTTTTDPQKIVPPSSETSTESLFSDTKPHKDESEDVVETAANQVSDIFLSESRNGETEKEKEEQEKKPLPLLGVRSMPAEKFVWNSYLLQKMKDENVHSDWFIHLIHGFIGQSKLAIFGKPMFVTLIARRSRQFAGTRFLKRGANSQGYVANEVETEQIIQDGTISSLHKGRISSITQLRGSLPLQWSQDISKMVPKPTITIDQSDPYGYIAGQHFNQLLSRYGSPIIMLNLVKKREAKRQESTLTRELLAVLQYLNQFLPPQHSIKYIGFDMARYSKRRDGNVMHRLAEIAEYCVKKTGFFMTGKDLYCNKLRPHPKSRGVSTSYQVGVVRTNCVDCLDRTNTAQFAIGKCALGLQLHAMGLLHNPDLDFDTDCVRMLEDLYENHGDTLALQYGGSQLVHRIKGYRKVAPWTSSSKDTMNTLSRYYRNAFTDSDKQQAMNLFLGVYSPSSPCLPALWELAADYYLHNPAAAHGPVPRRPASYSQWWDVPVYRSLPRAYEEVSKGEGDGTVIRVLPKATEAINTYWEHYRPYELTFIGESYGAHMSDTIRDFMPKGATNYSPFALRVRQGRRQEEYGNTLESNPNVSGKDSTSSLLSTGSNSDSPDDSSSDASNIDGDIELIDNDHLAKEESGLSVISLKDLFPTMAETYGMELHKPDSTAMKIYKKYSEIGLSSHQPMDGPTLERKPARLVQSTVFALDTSHNVEPPTVNTKSKDIYRAHIQCGLSGASEPPSRNLSMYKDYIRGNYL